MTEASIPEAEPVRLSRRDTALVIVDMQNDFCHPRGKLFVPTSPATIPNIRSLLEKARRSGVRVFFTQDWHDKDDPEFGIWGEHALAGSWGAEIVEELKPATGEVVVRKLRYDGFYGTSLDHYLSMHGVKNLLITGTVANICVLHTAGSAALRWHKIYVPVDCVSALTEFDLKAAFRQITFLYRGVLTRSELVELT
ncbi:MAG: cysteine hydrolase [Candidatus Caldarchaeum sp.]|nr:cysteine hydrolase [Candidatus Caldarchaeum sp.]MDW8360689.1 isochorismatase family cysteine hydrolase [Candidatus Caldarchaeum sp.]